jgi:signal transduction histidine kinase
MGDDPARAAQPTATHSGRRGWSLRTRLVLLATVGLAIGLAVGGVGLTILLRSALERASDGEARQTAQDVVVLVDAGRLPDPVPAGGTTLVQVVDQQGRVLAASAGTDRLVPAVSADQLSEALAGPVTVPGAQFGVLGPVRVIALPAGSPTDPSTVVVGSPAGEIDDAVRVVRTVVIIGFVLLLVVLAVVLWLFVGATLRPVEALRAGAEKITGGNSNDTLPLPDSADEIRRLAETLNDMLARLEVSRRRQRAFVADAAHELRSPLTSLRTQLEVAAATGGEPDPEDLVAEVNRLTALVEDLLLLAKVDDGTPPPRQRFDIAELAAAMAKRYAAARVPVMVEAADTPAVEANTGAVTRVLANLLDNAVRYAATGVRMTVRSTGGGAEVTVADDGPGIPAPDRERVFERFTRLQDARDRDSGGSGLGLAIVRELISQQGGAVTLADAVEGEDPPGLAVRVWFPPAGS